jgi:hypothetical protein
MNVFFKSLLAMIIVCGLAFTATGASAQTAKKCLPGCDCPESPAVGPPAGAGLPNSINQFGGVLGAMEDHSAAARVRDKAYSRQIIKQNDNALSMTCFDKSLIQSSKMGQIFSDILPSDMPIANNTVFGPSTYPDANADSLLIKNISNVLDGPMRNHAGNFPHSLSAPFGWAGLDFLDGFMGPINTIIGNIGGITGGMMGQAGSYSSTWGSFQSLIDALSALFPIVLPAALSNILAVLNSLLSQVNSAMGALGGQMTALNGILGSFDIAGGALNPDDPCRAMSKIWGGGGSILPAGFKSIIGSGSEGNTPYASFRDFLNPGSLGLDSGSGMLAELQNGNNSEIMDRARKLFDPVAGGILSGPGATPASPWSAPPVAPALTATTTEVINLMN